MNLILASQSNIRRRILRQSRIPFTSTIARIDEEAVTNSLIHEGAMLRDIPDTLAELKAQKVSLKSPGSFVLGCDQIMGFRGAAIGKPKSQSDLIQQMCDMAGLDHQLFTANVIYKDGKPVWRYVGVVKLTLRSMSDEQIETYVSTNWDEIKHCAGGYMFEKTPDLFTTVRGNWFDIMGLSIGPILNYLNTQTANDDFHPPIMAAVLGHPIAHSKSPKMHGHWLDQQNISADYIAIDIRPEFFTNTVRMLFGLGFAGFNVTLPHKEAALALADNTQNRARLIGAANTLWRDDKGGITADNTDGHGFMANLKSTCPDWDPKSGPALVLGAGGAARAILVSLIDAGVPNIFLTNRTSERAGQLAREFGDLIQVVDWDDRQTFVADSATIVNTTSLGMTGKPALALDLSTASEAALVTDLVYSPLETDLLKSARAQGCRVVGGLGMLLHQGVPGFAAWFGKTPTVDAGLEQVVLG